MTLPVTSLVLLAGMLVVAGAVALVLAVLPAPPRLADALVRAGVHELSSVGEASAEIGAAHTRTQRLGAATYRLIPLAPTDRQRQALRLQGRTLAEFYGDKAALAIAGGLIPLVACFAVVVTAGVPISVPLIVGLVGAVLGFFLPDWMLVRGAGRVQSAASEALLVYVDLVTLERLANASATQALHNAAQVSDHPLFLQLRTGLERARLEQQPPYAELRRLGEQLNLPELRDVADVMQLDESGASLAGSLRARVRELRGAHLTKEHVAASAAVEGMTIYMTIPTLIFGAIFLAAALLKIVLTG